MKRADVPLEMLNHMYHQVEAKVRREILEKFSHVPAEEVESAFKRSRFARLFVKFEIAADDVLHRLGGCFGGGGDQFGQFVVLGNDPVNAHLGGELDLFRGLLIRRIGGRHQQAVVALVQDDDAKVLADLGVQQSFLQPGDVQRVQIHQRNRERGRHGMRQFVGREGAGADQLGDEIAAIGLRLAVDFLGALA